MIKLSLTDEQADLLYHALRRHDGTSLCPDWPKEQRAALTKELDRLRGDLYPLVVDDD